MQHSKLNMFLNMPELHTKRLLMRKMLPVDCNDMFEYASREEVTRYLLWSPHPTVLTTKLYLNSIQREYSKGRHREWALICRENNKMIGTCGYTRIDEENRTAELGYVLNPEYWGYGYACEAANKLISIAFDYLEMERVEIHFMSENVNSMKVGEKCGMKFEGILRHSMFVKGIYRDIGICSILRDEYYKTHTPMDYSNFDCSFKKFMLKF